MGKRRNPWTGASNLFGSLLGAGLGSLTNTILGHHGSSGAGSKPVGGMPGAGPGTPGTSVPSGGGYVAPPRSGIDLMTYAPYALVGVVIWITRKHK